MVPRTLSVGLVPEVNAGVTAPVPDATWTPMMALALVCRTSATSVFGLVADQAALPLCVAQPTTSLFRLVVSSVPLLGHENGEVTS